MDYRSLGQSGLRISTITFGTMTWGGEGMLAALGTADIASARRQVDICLDAGVNFFDTANTYGKAEAVLGEVMEGRRGRMLVASKCRFPVGPGPNDQGLSRHHIIEQCEITLRRLRTDHIDLYQMHGWDGLTPLEETLAAFDHLVASGKVRYFGVSNLAGWQLMKMLGIAERRGLSRPVSQQIYYSLAAREAEYELAPIAVDQGVGILVWSPLSGGLLSAKYRGGAVPDGSRGAVAQWQDLPVNNPAALEPTLDALVEIAGERDCTPAQIALAWLLKRPGVSSIIVGARDETQLRANLDAAEIVLSDDEMQRLNSASRPPRLYPYWLHARYLRDRLTPADIPARD